jgi:hypothetical protein
VVRSVGSEEVKAQWSMATYTKEEEGTVNSPTWCR